MLNYEQRVEVVVANFGHEMMNSEVYKNAIRKRLCSGTVFAYGLTAGLRHLEDVVDFGDRFYIAHHWNFDSHDDSFMLHIACNLHKFFTANFKMADEVHNAVEPFAHYLYLQPAAVDTWRSKGKMTEYGDYILTSTNHMYVYNYYELVFRVAEYIIRREGYSIVGYSRCEGKNYEFVVE